MDYPNRNDSPFGVIGPQGRCLLLMHASSYGSQPGGPASWRWICALYKIIPIFGQMQRGLMLDPTIDAQSEAKQAFETALVGLSDRMLWIGLQR